MTYSDAERSPNDGAPIECYKFIGSFKNYLYTTTDTEVTVNGETYSPIVAKRGSIRAGTQSDDTLALEIELPHDTEVVRDYAYAESPPSLRLEVYRVHRGTNFATDWVLHWNGTVTAFSVRGRWASVRVPSIFSRALQSELPNVNYQTPCNHVLFDTRCKVARASFSSTSTVQATDGRTLQVADDGAPDNALAAGELVAARSGERRLILSNVANEITVSYSFVDLQVGDEVEMTYGCDHSFGTCKAKFTNEVNYGGMPYIPGDNPFQGNIG